jgi:peptidyl-prolyl cis-trans isomerase SurA
VAAPGAPIAAGRRTDSMTKQVSGQSRGMRIIVGVILGAGLAAGCRQAPQAPKTPGADVWATVNGEDIRRDDVEKAYRSMVDPSAPAPSPEELVTARLNILDQMIMQDILIARARAAGLEATDAEVDKAVADRKGTATDEAFQQQLTQRGFSMDDLKTGLRRQLTVDKLIARDVTAKIAVTDKEVADFYQANRAQFNLPETQYRLAQIVVTPVRDPQLRNRMNDDAASVDAARRKVEMIVERLKAGTEFSSLALDYSEDPQSLAQGGDLGFVPASTLARVSPQLRDAVLKMEPGNLTTVTVGSNYTILALISREPAGQRELSAPSVKSGIEDTLKGRKQDMLHTAYLAAARNDATITNYLAKQVVDAQGKVP